MSTKVYVAYRCRISKLKPVLLSLKAQMNRLVQKRMREVIVTSTKSMDPDYLDRVKKVMSIFEEASASMLRDTYCMDCGLSVWIDGQYAYLWPYGEDFVTGHLRTPKDAVDFRYWDNADMPKKVSQKAWKARGKVWDRLNDDESRLAFQVVDFSKGSPHNCRTMVWDLVKESLPKSAEAA